VLLVHIKEHPVTKARHKLQVAARQPVGPVTPCTSKAVTGF